MSDHKLISAQELSKLLSLSVDTIWRYTREKRIPYIEIGPRQYRYKEEDVLTALNQGTSSIKEESPSYSNTTKLTYEDYAKIPDEPGFRHELIDGCIVKEPSPSYHHQRLSRRLQRILENYIDEVDPKGEIFNAPLDVYFSKHTVMQPDILYIPGTRPVKNNPVDSLPELVVEVSSPSSTRKDRVSKLDCYLHAGVPHYWIVDIENKLIEAYELKDGYYVSIARYSEGTFMQPTFPGLTFNIDSFFTEPS